MAEKSSITDLMLAIRSVSLPNVFNPWRDYDELDVTGPNGGGPVGRCARLSLHFQRKPRFLLIGEAPGYQGCHFSGVAFTNERLMVDGKVPDLRWNRFTTRDKPWSEPSATVVWGTLHDLGIAAEVVMWNAFGWHPHKPGDLRSNRTPTASELRAGLPVLKAVVDHFVGAVVIAVGTKARDTLSHLGVFYSGHVRHPSMGGANEFRAGMRKIVEADGRVRQMPTENAK